jgi:hypothetical protein
MVHINLQDFKEAVMKIRNIVLFVLGVAVYFIAVMVVKSWDNRDMHLYLNEYMMQKFLSKLNDFDELKGYEFDLTTKLTGEAVLEPGAFSCVQQSDVKTAMDWIIHGGYSCDEPEAYQALRHFYDPVGIDGGRKYLTDIKYEAFLSKAVGPNPQIDAIEWALEDKGEITSGIDQLPKNYSFRDGTYWIVKAFEAKNETDRNIFMAKAWRSLGETLHLYGDMGLPCHVRNDGHPPYIGLSGNIGLPGLSEWIDWYYGVFGEPDPTEDFIRSRTQTHGTACNEVVQEIAQATSARDIFHIMATFTNNNFFSDGTIYGTGRNGYSVKPLARPNNPYTSPVLSESGGGWSYDKKTYTYYYDVCGQKVKMCKDCYYFDHKWDWRGKFPHVDKECSESMASVLLPTVINSGPYLIKRFFPKIELEVIPVIEAMTREIIVKVKHTTNDEYKSEIKYNGKIEVFINGKKKYTENAKDGELKIENAVLNSGDKVEARLVCGGIIVNSEKSDFEWRIIRQTGELTPDPNDIEITVPSIAKFGENFHIEGKWGQNVALYPDATYSIMAGWVKDTTQLWSLGSFEEVFYQPGPSNHHYFRLDIPIPQKSGAKYFKLQMSLKASMEDARYWLQGRIYKIPVK